MNDLVSVIKVLLALGLLGFLVYCIVTYIPMPDIFQKVIMVVAAVLVILWFLGILTGHGLVGSDTLTFRSR
jgi:hypothetical protein